MKQWIIGMLVGAVALNTVLVGRADEPNPPPSKLATETSATIELFKKTDPKLEGFFQQAVGYAVFPRITKGAIGIGAARGEGEVFAGGKLIGTVTMTQVTIGAQLGGQEYAELLFFEDQKTLDRFASSELAMSAQATAVAAADGAAATAKYQQGVAVFTIAKGGLMFEASVGGQKFQFTPVRKVPLY